MIIRSAAITVALLALGACASEYTVSPTTTEGVRYADGVPWLKSKKVAGEIVIAPGARKFSERMSFTVGAKNLSGIPANIGSENFHARTKAGKPLVTYSAAQLEHEVENRANMARLGTALGAGAQAYSAAQPTTVSSTGTVYGSGGYAGYTAQTQIYDPARNAAAQAAINRQAAGNMAAINYAQSSQINQIESGALKTTTLTPNGEVAGYVVVERPEFASSEENAVEVSVDFNGEQHEFSFTVSPLK